MRKLLYLTLALSLAIVLTFNGVQLGKVSAAEGEIGIKDILSPETLLLEDGSLWAKNLVGQSVPTPFNAVAISGDDYEAYGITSNGELFGFGGTAVGPQVVPGFTGIKQLADVYLLKNDGTVWTVRGQDTKLKDIALIASGKESGFGALSKSGEVYLGFKVVGTVTDASSVISMSAADNRVALLYDSGKVVVYETFNVDDNFQIVPYTVTEEAIHISYEAAGYSSLIVTLRDGSVWKNGKSQDRKKLDKPYNGLSQIVKTAAVGSATDFYAQRSDGSWVRYKNGEVYPFRAPAAKDLEIKVSAEKPYVGDTVVIGVTATYSNGAKVAVPANGLKVSVQKPHLLSLQPTGKLKVLGVGQSQVNVTANGISKTVTISSSLRNNLSYSKVLNGVVFVPVKSVFQALGATVTTANGGFVIKAGDVTLSLKAGDKNATLNGKSIKLKAAPITDNGSTLFPSSLLTEALGAKVTWNSQWKQAEIAFGDAKLKVVSTETAGLIKRANQGSLAQYIGKSYWVNYFQGWDRFMKVTVSDIVPDSTGSYVIVFKTPNGKTFESYPMFASYVDTLFADSSSFLNYDPYKKYNWSASVWQQIKAGQVSLGMTKEQVNLSWGSPSNKSVSSANGKTIEVWVYSNFDSVSFVNGKVTMIIA
jgi:Copper amine oxidase N-terminal domain.